MVITLLYLLGVLHQLIHTQNLLGTTWLSDTRIPQSKRAQRSTAPSKNEDQTSCSKIYEHTPSASASSQPQKSTPHSHTLPDSSGWYCPISPNPSPLSPKCRGATRSLGSNCTQETSRSPSVCTRIVPSRLGREREEEAVGEMTLRV